MKGFLTIGTPVYNDFNGVYFTLKSLQLYHTEVFTDSEIVVVDNNPYSPEGINTSKFCESLLNAGYNIKYIPFTENYGTAAAKQKVIESATSEWVLCCDSHVQFPPGVLDKLVDYMKNHPDSKDILCGPILMDDNKTVSTHFAYKWRGENLGIWATDPRGTDPNGEPFEILGTGMGAFAFRKAAWPGFHPKSRGFGSEEIYIHEKFRRNGGRALCLPFFRWSHRFGRPGGIPYPLYLWHKVRNYVLEFQELGWSTDEIYQYYVGGGYMSQQDWNALIKDPINMYDPPKVMSVAPDDVRFDKIKQFLEINADTLQKIVETKDDAAVQELAKKPEELAQSIKKLQDISGVQGLNERQNNIKLPAPEIHKDPDEPQFKEYTLSEFLAAPEIPDEMKKSMLEAVKKNPPKDGEEPKIRVQSPRRGKGGCSSCGKAKEVVSERSWVAQELRQLSTFKEVLEKNLPGMLGVNKEYYEKYIPGQKKIIEFGDDPLGSTLAILVNMDQDAVLLGYYQDPRYFHELVQLRRIAENENKIFEFRGFNPDLERNNFNLAEEVDTVVIDLMSPDFNLLNFVFSKTKDKVKNRYIIHKTGKYGAWTPEKELGQMPAVTKFLVENLQWVTLEHDLREQGITVLSKEKNKLPKIQRSSLDMVKSFAKSVFAHITSGGGEVTKEQLQERLSICAGCKHRAGERCSICGCFLVNGVGGIGKAKMKHEACPLGYWRPIKD